MGVTEGSWLGVQVGIYEGAVVGVDGATVGCSLGTLGVGSHVRSLVGFLVGRNTVGISTVDIPEDREERRSLFTYQLKNSRYKCDLFREAPVGKAVGSRVGITEGTELGISEGFCDGYSVGFSEGDPEGSSDGNSVGKSLG